MKYENSKSHYIVADGEPVESLFLEIFPGIFITISFQANMNPLIIVEEKSAVNEAMVDEIIQVLLVALNRARQNLASFANHPNIGWATFAVVAILLIL